ncbi:MAG: Holliday junction resolvase RuvX [Holosporales bacterium]|jgi:putative Holliday junction resolvase|nr:Holliday junction resolvase RuvX [Holosporales bacterium]
MAIVKNPKELCYREYIGKFRVLCLDYGDERIGIALSDLNWIIASPIKVLKSHGVYPGIFQLIAEHSVGIIVVGAPKSLSGGSFGKQFIKVGKFTEKLDELISEKNIDVCIVYWDERLSTVAANRFLSESELSPLKKKKSIDKVAASFILQGFLDYMNFNS